MAAAPLGSFKDAMPVELSPLPPSQGMEALKDIAFGSVSNWVYLLPAPFNADRPLRLRAFLASTSSTRSIL
jgi:hypothetical protein